MTTNTYIQATAPRVKGVGVDKNPTAWLIAPSCPCHEDKADTAYLVKATSTSGFGFHVPKTELKELKGKLA